MAIEADECPPVQLVYGLIKGVLGVKENAVSVLEKVMIPVYVIDLVYAEFAVTGVDKDLTVVFDTVSVRCAGMGILFAKMRISLRKNSSSSPIWKNSFVDGM